jgi:hypothetical protein
VGTEAPKVCWDLANVRRAGGVFGLRGRLDGARDLAFFGPGEAAAFFGFLTIQDIQEGNRFI